MEAIDMIGLLLNRIDVLEETLEDMSATLVDVKMSAEELGIDEVEGDRIEREEHERMLRVWQSDGFVVG